MSLLHFHDTAEHGHAHATPVEELDPRVKLASTLALAAWVSLVPIAHLPVVGLLCVAIVLIGISARIPPGVLVWRSAASLPFVLVPALLGLLSGEHDLARSAAMATRGYAAAMVAVLLVSVTPYPSVLAAASALGAPDLLMQTIALVYRYLHVLRERATAMMGSARARGYGRSSPDRFTVGGSMLGALLVRSLDRGERVHRSMLARGYTGRFPTTHPLKMRAVDWVVGASLLLSLAGSLAWMR